MILTWNGERANLRIKKSTNFLDIFQLQFWFNQLIKLLIIEEIAIANWPSPRFSQLAIQISKPPLYERASTKRLPEKVTEDEKYLMAEKRLNYILILIFY